MVVGNFVEPRLFGKSFELSPVVVLMSLAFWGSLWVRAKHFVFSGIMREGWEKRLYYRLTVF